MIQGATLGLKPAEVYALTLRELHYHAEGRKRANKGEHRQRLYLTWLGARLSKPLKRFPRWDEMVKPEPTLRTPEQAGEALRDAAPILVRMFGGKRQEHKKSRPK